MQANTQSVPSRVLESAQVENGVFGLRRGVVRGELSEAASGVQSDQKGDKPRGEPAYL